MLSFGCKQQLRHEILTNDAWFANAEQMVQFLTKYFSNDSRKEYYSVDAAETAQIRIKEKGEFKLKLCRQFHVIGVNQKGNFSKVLYFRDQYIVSTLFYKTVSSIDKEHDDDGNQTEPAFSLNHDTIFELVDLGTFVGIRGPPNAMEPFFIVEMFNKGVAQEGMSDNNGHYIISGEQYAEVGCFVKKKKDEKKRVVQYQCPKKQRSIYIHVVEVFVTNVALDEIFLWIYMNINQFLM